MENQEIIMTLTDGGNISTYMNRSTGLPVWLRLLFHISPKKQPREFNSRRTPHTAEITRVKYGCRLLAPSSQNIGSMHNENERGGNMEIQKDKNGQTLSNCLY